MIDLDYCVRFIDLPLTTKGVTVEDADGFFNIYINENLKNDLSLGAVAAALGYHPASLSRYFKNCFQMSFNRYVTLVRLRQAVLLMKEKKNSIVYCAFESGFNSVRTFYRAFQAEFGCSPKEYLKTACNPAGSMVK